jgi:hypothetical protein
VLDVAVVENRRSEKLIFLMSIAIWHLLFRLCCWRYRLV